MTSQPFGIYFQCHKNPLATFKALESARKFYPECTIVLLSDDGYNYTEMAKFFHCMYIHETNKATFVYEDLKTGSHIEHSNRLLERVRRVFNMIPEDYVMWLEDDVVINAPIKDTFKYAINGYCPNHFLDRWKAEVAKAHPHFDPSQEYRFTGHGGSVFEKKAVLAALDNQSIIDDILENWVARDFPTTIGGDFLISWIVTLSGYTIGPYEGHGDQNGYINPSLCVQHQYKVFYGYQLPHHLSHLISQE